VNPGQSRSSRGDEYDHVCLVVGRLRAATLADSREKKLVK
jgi:hypothetical protein